MNTWKQRAKELKTEVLAACRQEAREVMKAGKPVNRTAAAMIVVIWLLLAALAIHLVVQFARK